MNPKLLLIGGGGHCKSVIDVIEQENKYAIAGIVDQKEFIGQNVLGYEIIGSDDHLSDLFQKIKYALVTVGQLRSPDLRIKLFSQLNSIGFETPTFISPRAYVAKHAIIGRGTIVMHDVLINADVTIGHNCIINSKSLIEHDCVVEDHCHISTGAILNGGTVIKTGSFFGSGAVSKEYMTILENSFIKAGSIVK